MNLGGSIRINKCAVFALIAFVVLLIYIFSPSLNNPIQNEVKSQQSINLRKLVIGLIWAAKQGGEEVVKVSQQPDFGVKSKGHTKEGVDDPVTVADVYSHCRIAHGLWRIFPKLQLISEEDVEQKNCPSDDKFFGIDPSVIASVDLPDVKISASDITVWIDPLDATKEYTEKLFHYVSVMICVAVKGEPVIGVVHFPFDQKTYWAWKGHGMSENLQKVKVSHDETVKTPVVIVSRSHAGEVEKFAQKKFGEKVKIIPAAGSGFKIVQVMEGNATLYLHNTRIKKWDLCAGNAIVDSVGGKMHTLKDEVISYAPDADHVVEDGLWVELNKHVILET